MEPSGLEDALFTIRRTAQLAVAIAADHKERLKAQAASELLIEDCRQFIFDAFDKHGYDVHDDGCAEDDTCSCPRAVQANALLHGWVAK
jgi:hypothetical protein